jgi:tetratricopeptide (TPR) repeat protein
LSISPDAPAASAGANPRRKLVRFLVVLAVGVALAVLLDVAVLHVGRPRSKVRQSRLAVFAEPAGIRELLVIADEQPRDPEWQLRLGREFLRLEHYLSAQAALNKALAMGAPEAPVRWALTTCYERLDQHDEALQQLERLRALEPDNLAVPLRIASVYSRPGQRRDARAALDAIPLDARGFPTLRDPQGPLGGLERLGVAYGLQEDWPRSLSIAQRLLREKPGHVGANAIAGHALLSMGKPGDAARHFRAALAGDPDRLELRLSLARSLESQHRPEHDGEIVRLLEPLVQTGAPPGEVLYSLAVIHERQRRWDWAAAYYTAAARMGTRTVAAHRRAYENHERAGHHEQALFLRGRELEMQNRFPQAIRLYRELIRFRPKSDAGHRHLARVLLATGDARGAVAALQQAAKLKSPNPRVFMRLALAYQKLGDRKRKDEAWEEFRKRRPEEAYLIDANEATAADTAGRLDEAEARLRRCVELQPKATQYRIRLGQLLIERRTDRRRVDEAIGLLEESVGTAREDVDAHLALGTAYRYSGLAQEAVWAMRHAIDLDPGNGRPYQLLGETLVEAGSRAEGMEMLTLFKRFREYAQALDVLSLRLKRNPRDTDVARRLGAIQERSGALAEARATYSRIVALDPKDAWARRRLAEVQGRLGEPDQDADEMEVGALPQRAASE